MEFRCLPNNSKEQVMKKLSLSILGLLLCFYLLAQQTPAPAQSKAIALVGGTIHQGNGSVIENGAIAFDEGKIVFVGKAGELTGEFESIDTKGKDIYPGLIAINTTMGLVEIGAVRATADHYEVGQLNPNVRSLIAFNTDSRVIPTVRSNGVLLAQIVPHGGTMPGTSSIVQLDAWNWEDAAYQTDDGIYLDWPSMYKRTGSWWNPGPIENNKDYGTRLSEIESLLAEAKGYGKGKNATTNLKLEALQGLYDKSKKLYVYVARAKEIMDVIELNKKFNFDLVLVGATDAWMLTDLLKEHDVPVVIEKTHSLPSRSFEDIDLPYRMPAIMKDAGVDFALTLGDGWDSFWDQRNLPFHAGTSVAYGLTKEEALESITLSPAKILGIDDRTGSLETGKDANILVSEGDLLDVRSSKVTLAYIQGREIDLNNKQKDLYRKFMKKYGKEVKE